MTFKIRNHQLNNHVFVGALKELGNAELDVKVAWNVKRMLKQFDSALNAAGKKYAEVVKQYCIMEDGKIVPEKNDEGENMPNSFTFEEGKEKEFQDAMKDFMAEEYEIESYKIRIDELEGAKISATTLTLLEPILEE